MTAPAIKIETVVSNPFQQNTYIVWREGRDDCVVFDPGMEPQKIVDRLEKLELRPAAFLITHAHPDHIAGNGTLKDRWPDCPIVVGELDAIKLDDPRRNLSAAMGVPIVSPPADATLADGETYSAAGIDFEVLLTPGHSSGHISLLVRDAEPMRLFSGDVLFAGSIGRTDFPDCSFEVLKRSIDEKLFSLPDDTVVYSGHGPLTTIGQEKQTNPFVGVGADPSTFDL